jgi:DNA-binding response OmpR family regulator
LLSRVRALLRRAYGEFASTEGDVLYAGDLTIDRASAQVRRGDEIIALTPIEFRLLVYLAQHAGQALTRAQILEAVWGFEADPDSDKTVNVHIRRLRQKVELDPDAPTLILTVPGVGYRLTK